MQLTAGQLPGLQPYIANRRALSTQSLLRALCMQNLQRAIVLCTLAHMQGDLNGPQLQCSRMEVPGGPVFSLQRGIKTKITDVNAKPREPVLFCGTAAKEITALRPDTLTFSQQVGHELRLAANSKPFSSSRPHPARMWCEPRTVICWWCFVSGIAVLFNAPVWDSRGTAAQFIASEVFPCVYHPACRCA